MGYQQNPLKPVERIVGAVFVLAAITMTYYTMGSAANLLSLGLLGSYFMWAAAIWLNDPPAVIPLYLIGIAIQALHFGEEYLTGFQKKFPALFGQAWTDKQFIVYNLIWFALFLLAALGVWLRFRLAYLILFFFAITGEIGNGLGHLALSIAQRKYFPGTVSAAIIMFVGVALLTKLLKTAEHLPDQDKDAHLEEI